MNNSDLLQFQKPGRYLGKEWGLKFKKPASKDLRICLCFPESYEVGMSNLGFRIIHELFGSHPNVSCERCFMPAEDMAEYLLKNNRPLFSLETKTPLGDFDTLAFSLNYELNFFNLLKMLRLSGIELKSQNRDKPLIIAGGLNNPEPVAEFIDLFFLGEFEESSFMFIEQLKKTRGLEKQEKLAWLAQIEGTYVPCLYSHAAGGIKPKDKKAPFPLNRAYVKDLNKHFYPKEWVVPYIAPVFDRLQVELQRGCPHHCKFCQAQCIYYPYRQRRKELVIERIISSYEATGYEVISLLGLSVIDYSGLEDLLDEIIPYLKKQRVGLSIPSLRPTAKAPKIIERLTYAKKPGITVALEAGNETLRRAIGKDIKMEDCLELVRTASHTGYKRFKFYFMLGLPNETNDDVLTIADTLENIAQTYKKERGFVPEINASISYFIPKPFTSFEGSFMQEPKSFEEKVSLLKQRLRNRRFIKLKTADYERSLIEYLLARADRRISPLLEEMFLMESRDPLSFLKSQNWFDAARRQNIDLDMFLQSTDTLPRHIQLNRDKCLAAKS